MRSAFISMAGMSFRSKSKFFFLLSFSIAILIFASSIVSAAVLYKDYKFTIDVPKDTITREMEITGNQEPGYFYYSLTTDYISGEILDWEQTGGKKCRDLEPVKEKIDGIEYTYIECSYDDNEFLQGDFLALKVVSRCDCTYKNGLDLFVYPSDIKFSEDVAGSVENIVYAPEGYLLYNYSFPRDSFTESANGVVGSFKENLNEGQSLYDIYGQLFFHLKKDVDFSRMKQLREGKISLSYPSGYDDEAQNLIDGLAKILPEFEKYAGETKYDDIAINLVPNESVLDGYCGQAHSASTPENKDGANVSITCASGNPPFHELCHLSEKPFDYPSWFSEGQAENCGSINLMAMLGRADEAKQADESNINSSRLAASLPNLGEWIPAEETNESDDTTTKGYGLSYALFKEILPFVDMPEFYTKVRKDFKGYEGSLPNDAIICKMNEVSKSNLIPTFERYGFKIEPCSKKTYYFLEGAIYVYRFGSWSEEINPGEVWLLNGTDVSLMSPEELVALKKGDLSLLNGAALLWLKNETLSVLGEDETYVFKGVNGSLLVPSNQSLLKEGEIIELSEGNESIVKEGAVLLFMDGKLSAVKEETAERLANGDWELLKEGRLFLFKETKISSSASIFGFIAVFIVFIVVPAAAIYGIWRLFKKRKKK